MHAIRDAVTNALYADQQIPPGDSTVVRLHSTHYTASTRIPARIVQWAR